MADEKKSKSQSFTKRFEEEFEIPEHLAASIRAMGASFAQGKFQKPSVPLSTKPKNSPEELAKLIDHLQETFGAKVAGNSVTGATKKSGQAAPPPSPFAGSHNVSVKKSGKYHAYMEEAEDEHWTKKS